MKTVNSTVFRQEMLNQILNRGKSDISAISASVKEIVDDVKQNGDKALVEYTQKFDNVTLKPSTIRVTPEEIKAAYKKLTKKQVNALKKAATNIAAFHKQQLKTRWTMQIAKGVTAGQVIRPISSVGVYAPGGKASYPSSVLMCAIPAKVAGVETVVVCSPPTSGGDISAALLVAADVAGVDAVYRVGGAQAVAAMSYGTGTVQKVDKIVGPGNVYVTAAKLQVNTDVAIDIPAGPSEVLVIADETADAACVASDLLAQAEHDPQAWAVLVTSSEPLAKKVNLELEKQVKSLSRTQIIASSLQKGGLIVTVKDIEEAIELTNLIAPEHLQIQTKNPDKVLDKIKNAGAIFLGRYSPVAFGDYSAGLNHVLPTAGYAKIYSGLSSYDFIKTMNYLQCTKEGYENLQDTAVTIAEMEGFDAHAKSVKIRGDEQK
ncbi:MAG: histidinol dehydrogenase [Candidatus Bathyarchaeia archaeon]|jgi:histidinol dehydrogenase